MIRVDTDVIDCAASLAAFDAQAVGAGAVASFAGKVRGEALGEGVKALLLEHYPGVTEVSIQKIAEQAVQRWPISHYAIRHRVGTILPGETIVLVCAAAAHRRAAFEAVDFMMDYLKSEALFWKKEQRETGDFWIEPREEDYLDAERWRSPDRA